MSKTYTLSVNKNEIKASETAKRSEAENKKTAKNNYKIEKNVLTAQNKQVKANVSKVASYADIVLGNKKKETVVAKTTQKVAKSVTKKTTAKPKNKVVEREKTVAKTIVMPEADTTTRNTNVLAEVSERIGFETEYDSDAQRVINVARMGSLFDYLD